TDFDSRRFEAGSGGQTSMRNGDLAGAEGGWGGDAFVIDRKVPGRWHQTETLRLLKKTGQLEYIVKWAGDTGLAGDKMRRVFDPVTVDPNPPDPNVGPVR